MKVEIFLILFYFGVHHSCSSDEPVTNENYPLKKDFEVLKLLNDSLQSESGHKEANAIYKQKYGQKRVEISHVSKGSDQFLSHNNCLYIDHGLAEDFLKAFGNSIEKLTIAYRFIPSFKHRRISELVNIYCHETLVEFEAKYCQWVPGALDDMREPFKKVERVIFNGEWKELNETTLGLGDLFPEMSILNLSYEDGYIFNHNYPHLVELIADKPTSLGFTKFIENNPQIKKLRVQDTSVDFLKVVNEKLPELEVFAFTVPKEFKQYNGSKFLFENVTEVLIRDTSDSFKAEKLGFKQLNNFTMAAYVDSINDEWIDFIGDNKNLKILFVSVGYLNNTSLMKLTKKTGSLVEAKIRCNIYTDSDTIAQFIENNKHMETVTLTTPRDSVKFTERLAKTLKKEWKVAPVNNNLSVLLITKSGSTANLGSKTDTQNLTEKNDQTITQSLMQNNDQSATEIITQAIEQVTGAIEQVTGSTAAENSTQNTIGTTAEGGASSIYKSESLTIAFLVLISSIFVLI